jgi:thymidylate kinase
MGRTLNGDPDITFFFDTTHAVSLQRLSSVRELERRTGSTGFIEVSIDPYTQS